MKTRSEKVVDALYELKAKAIELGIGEYFDGLDSTEILVMSLYRWEKYLEANLKGIKEDMEIDSESDEPNKKTRDEMLAESESNYKCPECGTDCSAITCPKYEKYWCEVCGMDVDDEGAGNCPNCGHWLLPEDDDLIEETDYLEEDDNGFNQGGEDWDE